MAYYSIGDLAKIFQIDTSTLRNWETKGIISSIRTPGNHRRYGEKTKETIGKEIKRKGGFFKQNKSKE